jgi:flagellar hook capping protein FlgD
MNVQLRGPSRADSRSIATPFRWFCSMRPLVALRVAAVLALAASPVGAVRAPDAPTDAGISLPGDGAVSLADAKRRARFQARAPWREFTARHGGWNALWNARTGSPHRAFGPAIRLPGFADRAGAVEGAVRAFIAGNPALFGAPALETRRVQKVRGTWYVSFHQVVRGMPVLFSDWEFRVGANGRLSVFGADVHRIGNHEIPTISRLPSAVAREAARAGLRFEPGRDAIEGGESLALLPIGDEDGLSYRVVTEARVVTAEPPADWRVLVDAASGEVLWRQNFVRHAISGTVTGTVHSLLPTDPAGAQPLANLTVNVGPTPANTGPAGTYSEAAAGAVTVSAQLLGPWCNVNRQDGVPDASFSAPATDPATVDIAFNAGNSHDAERDGFYHVNVVHDYVKALDALATNIDYAAICRVNINNTCNAYFSTSDGSVNFYRAGGGCPNTATMPDVVYHEYGHLVNHEIYQQAGVPSGMGNGALHEGMSDVLAAMIQDSPDGGKGFFGPGTILRTIDNTRRWPQDASGDGHITGLIIGGAFWDLRQSAGLAVAEQLSHFAKYGVPDDFDDGVAMNEYFIETLVADDDDADLGNGTPNGAAIISAFNAHGIGTGFFMSFVHTALEDQPGAGPYAVTGTVAYSGPFGSLDGAPILYYAFNNGAYQSAAMTPTGNPDEFTASIPGTSGAVVSYYLSATDTYGEASTDPDLAPAEGVHRFLAGPATTLVFLNMETDPGWDVSAPGDNAITGHWLLTEPIGSQVIAGIDVQPEDDHTPGGALCFVTGNAGVLEPAGVNDVDGGRTTLVSAFLDATAVGLVDPVISYYRWYTNDQGSSPGLDLWRVDISNDGGFTWVSVESTTRSNQSWQRILFRIADYVTPTDEIRLRFIAEDAGAGSLVEAAVDDLRLSAFPSVVAVGDGPPPGALALSLGSSHPTVGALRLNYRLPAAGLVSLTIYDLGGRAVRTLAAGHHEAGGHAAEWDGRDDRGATLPSGTYFARLEAAGSAVSRTLVRTR